MRKLKKIDIGAETHGIYSTLIKNFLEHKSKTVYQRMAEHISGSKILDVGTGAGGIAGYIKNKGFTVESIDIDDSSLIIGFPTTLYNGETMPFEDKTFDTAVIVHVLHHCSDGLGVLREAARVARKVIFIEDTYLSKIERVVVSFSDMIGNNEFYEHYYRTPTEWDKVIKENGWQLLHSETYSELTYGFMYGRYIMCVVE